MNTGRYTVDPKAICAEMRAVDLLVALANAVNGAPNWRLHARMLLADIEALRLPKPAFERLRELDAMKRAAEIAQDVEADHAA
jgi:hypothetical protein